MQTKQVIAARREQAKGKVVDEHILKNSNDADWNAHFEQAKDAVTKERKPREVKVKHAPGSPQFILHSLVDTLSSTQADYLHRHIIKKALKDEHADATSFEGELYTGLRSKVLPETQA
jgi:hypothetical protein